jgi:CheY-like chemotaxis protein
LIALTGYGRTGDLEAAIDAGYDAHCAKPISTGELLKIIAGDLGTEELRNLGTSS